MNVDKTDLDDLLLAEEAGSLLKVDRRTIPRFVKRGFITGHPVGRVTYYQRSELEGLDKKFRDRASFGRRIKELYVLTQSGFSYAQLSAEFELPSQETLDNALQIYRFERQMQHKQHATELAAEGIAPNDYDCILTTQELNDRLKISCGHVIPDIIDAGLLDGLRVEKERKVKYFVSVEALQAYLGSYSREFLYRSHHVENGLTIKDIDRIAKRKGMGFKIKPTGQGNYLFSKTEIEYFRGLSHQPV